MEPTYCIGEIIENYKTNKSDEDDDNSNAKTG